MKLYHSKLRNKKNVVLLNDMPTVQINEDGYFNVSEEDSKIYKRAFPKVIFSEGENGFVVPITKIEKSSDAYALKLEIRIEELEKENAELKTQLSEKTIKTPEEKSKTDEKKNDKK